MTLQSEPTTVLLSDNYLKRPLAQAVPGAVWKAGEGWVVDVYTARQAYLALTLFPEIGTQYPELNNMRASMIRDVRPFDNATPFNRKVKPSPEMQQRLDDLFTDEGGFNRITGKPGALHEYQELDLGYIEAIMREHGAGYIGWDRGMGKTSAACVLADVLDVERMIVVCRNNAKTVIWAKAVKALMPDHQCVVIPNDKKKREEALATLHKRKHPDPYVLIVHYESLPLIAGKDDGGKLTDKGWRALGDIDLIVTDEAHRLQNPNAKFVRALKRCKPKYRLALSGSIIQNRLEELFSVLNWLFPTRYKAKWRDWNDRYLDYLATDYGRVCLGVKENKVDDLRAELGVFTVYRRKEDELDLPEKMIETVMIPMLPEQERVYKELQQTLLAEIDDAKSIKALNPISLLGKLRQIATSLGTVGGKGSAKLDRAVEMILENEDEEFVVFSWFKEPCYELMDRLEKAGVEAWIATGDQSEDARTEAMLKFQEGERRVFTGTIATLSESVELQRASNVIFLDRSWNPEETGQAIDRVHRQGQQRTTVVTHLISSDTVDELRVQPIVANKQALRALVLGETK